MRLIRTLMMLATVLATNATAPAAEPVPAKPPTQSYDAAAAHDPQFDDKSLWPHYTGKEEYARQSWTAGRVLVWAGGSGGFGSAEKWLEDGKPAKRPPDQDTDVVFPAAGVRYSVSASAAECRHITIGRNAQVAGGQRQIAVHGNCWVKEGGKIDHPKITGDQCTFFRADVPPESVQRPHYEKPAAFPHTIHDKMSVGKFRGASVEFLGTVGVRDEIYIAVGKMIIGPDSQFRTNVVTGNGTMEVFDGATLELQSGAEVVNHRRTALCNIAFHVGSTLQAGSPQRPITRDAYVRPDPCLQKREPRMFFAKGSSLRVYSADAKTARLVFESNDPGKELPPGLGLELSLGGNLDLGGVVFDQIAPGGLLLPDVAARAGWKNVVFGPHNAAEEGKLLARTKIDRLGGQWNTRDIKYRQLVVRHLEDMEKSPEPKDATSRPAGP